MSSLKLAAWSFDQARRSRFSWSQIHQAQIQVLETYLENAYPNGLGILYNPIDINVKMIYNFI